MADKWPVVTPATWENPAHWNNGTLPELNDDIYADGKTVYLQSSIIVKSLRTTQRSGGTIGGTFITNGGTDIEIIAESFIAGAEHVLQCLTSLRATVYGAAYGSNTAGKNGLYLNSETQTTFIGNSYGGAGSSSSGVYMASSNVQIGNCYAGTGSNAHGTSCAGGSVVFGNSYGSSGNHATAGASGIRLSGLCIQIGDSFGGSGINGRGTALLGGTQYGNCTGGSASGAHGTHILSTSFAFIEKAEGQTAGAFGFKDQGGLSTTFFKIRQEVGLYAKEILSPNSRSDDSYLPFLSYNCQSISSLRRLAKKLANRLT
jgi:hypothetical protein